MFQLVKTLHLFYGTPYWEPDESRPHHSLLLLLDAFLFYLVLHDFTLHVVSFLHIF